MLTNSKTFIIAEAGVNHNGSLKTAFELIDAAVSARVDAVKFQTFRAEGLVTKHASKAEYQKITTDSRESQFEMIKKLELTEHDHKQIIEYCQKRRIKFMSTPFDNDSLRLLTNKFGMKLVKVSSGDITNAPFLLDISRVADEIILSTGMSNLSEIESALGVLSYGFSNTNDLPPSISSFEAAYAKDESRELLRKRVSLLHCTTEYPANPIEVNLLAMDTMSKAFGLRVGFSDHTKGIHIPIAAVARGAAIIEKHFTLDQSLNGPDHKASLEPEELKEMVSAIRDVEMALGDGIKRPTKSEWKNRSVVRKSLVAAQPVQYSEPLVITCKRPGDGCSPYRYWEFDGTSANRSYESDEAIDG